MRARNSSSRSRGKPGAQKESRARSKRMDFNSSWLPLTSCAALLNPIALRRLLQQDVDAFFVRQNDVGAVVFVNVFYQKLCADTRVPAFYDFVADEFQAAGFWFS